MSGERNPEASWLGEVEASIIPVLRDGLPGTQWDVCQAALRWLYDPRVRQPQPGERTALHSAVEQMASKAQLLISADHSFEFHKDQPSFWRAVHAWLELTKWHDEVDFRLVSDWTDERGRPTGPVTVEPIPAASGLCGEYLSYKQDDEPVAILLSSSSLTTLEHSISEALVALRGTGQSIVADSECGCYFQMASYEANQLLAETVSNAYLPKTLRLRESQEKKLVQLGFSRPTDDAPNWWIFIEDGNDDDIARAAHAVAVAMKDVYHDWKHHHGLAAQVQRGIRDLARTAAW